jgi:hypothetical protein
MSDPGREIPPQKEPPTDAPSQGPNLVVLYGFIALALVAAIGLALLIVLPFYNRR